MGKQNGKKVSQKQRSQKKSSSLKKYKKKGGSSQKGGIGYKYDVLIGKEDGGLMAGTREGFMNAIFDVIQNSDSDRQFPNLVINPYVKPKKVNTQYTPSEVIKNIIVPYFFTLPGTRFNNIDIPSIENPKDFGIQQNIQISAFQYAILKGRYALVDDLYSYCNYNGESDTFIEYVNVPLAKSNGTDILLTQPYYLPFTQGYYDPDNRLIVETKPVLAEIMQRFVALFNHAVPGYTTLDEKHGGDNDNSSGPDVRTDFFTDSEDSEDESDEEPAPAAEPEIATTTATAESDPVIEPEPTTATAESEPDQKELATTDTAESDPVIEPEPTTATAESEPEQNKSDIEKLFELLKTLMEQRKIPQVSIENGQLEIVINDQQRGDQEKITVNLMTGGKQLNIIYLKDGEQKELTIVLNPPQSESQP